jgi:UDP-N-acetylmuramoyl-L-alanyl-D-glutamate--2,6-diaminopimelate ligase
MPEVTLDALFNRAGIHASAAGNIAITDIVYDSRRCRPGCLFVAVPGHHTDGHHFIPQAVAAGAVAVVHQAPFDPAWTTNGECTGPVFTQVPDARRSLSSLAAAFHGNPSRELCIIGITGTDGKSSTVWFTYQLLRALGVPAGFVSTVALEPSGTVIDNPWRQSTPEAPEIQRSLREMVSAGKRVAVVEATSHGLSAKTHRLADVTFDIAVFTNLSHEHLEFHGSYEQYRSDKGNLFRGLGERKLGEHGAAGSREEGMATDAPCGPVAIVNADDGESDYFADLAAQAGVEAVRRYSIGANGADLTAFLVEMAPLSTRIALDVGAHAPPKREGNNPNLREATIPLPGWFNVSNVLAAVLAAASAAHVDVEEVFPHFSALSAVPGRLEPVESSAPFSVVVDYAHTPGSFEKVLPLFRDTTLGRVIAVFGSAGERDVEKRGQQGAVAGHFCELLILTDEDPRGEDRMAIIDAIAAGATETTNERTGQRPAVVRIPDRRAAIRRAFTEAQHGDTVVLLGKGHEKSIIYATQSVDWDEARVAREVLTELGYQCS